MLVGNNGLIKLTGAATLPVGGAVMALSALPLFASPGRSARGSSSSRVLACAIVVLSVVGFVLKPSLVPGVPSPRSAPAIALFAFASASTAARSRFGR